MNIAREVQSAREQGVAEANLPFLLRPRAPCGAGVLLVHGFTASPWEMRGLGEALAGAGFVAYGLRLPGHGTRVEDLAACRYETWVQAVDLGCRRLAAEGLRVYGIGLSTGALLLAALSVPNPLRGLVLLSPFLRLRHRLAPAAALLRFVKPYQPHPLAEHLKPFYYARRPVAGIYQLLRLTRRVRKNLPRIEAPTLVVSAAGDRTVDAKSARDLFQGLRSRDKDYHLFGPEVPHVLTTGENPRQAETFHLILDFLRRREPHDGFADA